MRAIGLVAMLCGFGAGLITFPVLVAHFNWHGGLVTLMGLTLCVIGAISTIWLINKSSPTKQPPQS